MGALLRPRLALPLCALAACIGVRAAPAVEIRMHAVVNAPAGQLLLGDAATIHAMDLAAISSLVALPLGHAPAAGRETLVRRDTIARWVRTRLGFGPSEIAWAGADELIVRGPEEFAPAVRAPVVRRGDWASLRAHAGAIEIEDHVKILQDGAAGDFVQVRGSTSEASFPARVVGRGLVETNP